MTNIYVLRTTFVLTWHKTFDLRGFEEAHLCVILTLNFTLNSLLALQFVDQLRNEHLWLRTSSFITWLELRAFRTFLPPRNMESSLQQSLSDNPSWPDGGIQALLSISRRALTAAPTCVVGVLQRLLGLGTSHSNHRARAGTTEIESSNT